MAVPNGIVFCNSAILLCFFCLVFYLSFEYNYLLIIIYIFTLLIKLQYIGYYIKTPHYNVLQCIQSIHFCCLLIHKMTIMRSWHKQGENPVIMRPIIFLTLIPNCSIHFSIIIVRAPTTTSYKSTLFKLYILQILIIIFSTFSNSFSCTLLCPGIANNVHKCYHSFVLLLADYNNVRPSCFNVFIALDVHIP